MRFQVEKVTDVFPKEGIGTDVVNNWGEKGTDTFPTQGLPFQN